MSSDLPSRPGFTTIEVLAATLLASALMVAVLGVIAGIGKKEKLLEQSSIPPVWHEHLRRQLEYDLRATDQFRRKSDRLILVGHGGNSGATGQPDWFPAEIHYYSMGTKESTMLVRQVRPVNGLGKLGAPEVILYGATGIDLLAYTASPQVLDQALISSLPEGMIPSRLEVIVTSRENVAEDPLYRQSLILY